MNETPIYASKSIAKNLWQEYLIYEDRLEINTLFGRMPVPFEHIERVDVSGSEIKGLLRGNLHLKNFRPALKVDWANFLEHVVLDKSEGYIRRILFTPDDPETFKKHLDGALARYREKFSDGEI